MAWAMFTKGQNAALIEIANSDSPRVIAILGGAMLDESLRRALEFRFRQHENTNKKLFSINGGLGNLGSKIDLAFQLYMINSQMRKAMEGINEIRNEFAHQLDTSFDAETASMTRALKKLTLHEGKTRYPNTEQDIELVVTNEDRFRINLQLALLWLFDDNQKHVIWSNTPINFRYVPPD